MNADVFWLEHPTEAWLPVTLGPANGHSDTLLAKAVNSPFEFEVSAEECKSLARVHPSALLGVSNMISLEDLNEGVILNTLRDRFKRDKIYTYISSILVSINPYKHLNTYGSVAMECVKNRHLSASQIRHLAMLRKKAVSRKASEPSDVLSPLPSTRQFELASPPLTSRALELPTPTTAAARFELGSPAPGRGGTIDPREPHVYVLAADVHRALINSNTSQSVIISGESGAGKTEATKFILEYLSYLSREVTQEIQSEAKDPSKSVEAMILEANPVIEAFGNAQTVRNDNSSRFGKWVEIHFDSRQCISGGCLSHYLLEKTRVVQQSPGERNYHVFYQITSWPSIVSRYNLKPATEYAFIQQGNPNVDTTSEQWNWARTQKAFEALNFSAADITSLLDTLVAILWLGEVPVTATNDNADVAHVDVTRELITAAELLGVQATELAQGLVSSLKAFGRGEKIRVQLKVVDAQANRDALCKYLYSKTFDAIIKNINKSLKTDKYVFGVIGVLDIFGFEIFETNRFEQFLINYANEKLQRHFNHFVFELEQEEYQREGLRLQRVEFTDNRPCVELMEKTPNGVLAMLDEELRLPKGSDENFLERCHNTLRGKYYVKPKVKSPEFGIRHYAGEVTYMVEGFLEKNRDTLNESLVVLVGKSHKPFYVDLCAEDMPSESKEPVKGPAAARSLGGQFKAQLQGLTDKIESTNPHFIRCIKSNDKKAPNTFAAPMVVRQLRYAGIQAVVEVRRHGFPFRLPHKEFFQRFRLFALDLKAPDDKAELLLSEDDRPQGEESAWGGKCALLLKALDPEASRNFQLGHTKVFVTHERHLELERKREDKRKIHALALQCGWRARKPRMLLGQMKQVVAVLGERLTQAHSQTLQSLLANGGAFIQTLEDALEDSRVGLLPPGLPVLKEVKELHISLIAKDISCRHLASVVEAHGEVVAVYEKALQAAREAGEDMQTLEEYQQCVQAKAQLEALIEQRRQEAEERDRLQRELEQTMEEQRKQELEQERRVAAEREAARLQAEEEERQKEAASPVAESQEDILARELERRQAKAKLRRTVSEQPMAEEKKELSGLEAENAWLKNRVKILEESALAHEKLAEESRKLADDSKALFEQMEETRVYRLKVADMEQAYLGRVKALEDMYQAKIIDLSNRLAAMETVAPLGAGKEAGKKILALEKDIEMYTKDLREKCNQVVRVQTEFENMKAKFETAEREKKETSERERAERLKLEKALEKERIDRQIAESELAKYKSQNEKLEEKLKLVGNADAYDELQLKLDESAKYGDILKGAMSSLLEANKRLQEEKKKLEDDLRKNTTHIHI